MFVVRNRLHKASERRCTTRAGLALILNARVPREWKLTYPRDGDVDVDGLRQRIQHSSAYDDKIYCDSKQFLEAIASSPRIHKRRTLLSLLRMNAPATPTRRHEREREGERNQRLSSSVRLRSNCNAMPPTRS